MDEKNELKRRDKFILHGLSMLLPMLILGTAFAIHGIAPFGNRQIMVSDFWSQYYPFLSDFWHKLRDGNSLLWSWTAGAGHDYVAHIGYYLASPLNLLIVLFPHSILREVITALLLVKVGLAGLFMSLYLRLVEQNCAKRDFAFRKEQCPKAQIKRPHGFALPIFSSLYALCAFTLGYYWNIMWFDTFAVLPLVMLGVHFLVRENKYLLYIVSLAMAVFFNFYIGLFVCIFVAIMFFMQCYIAKLNVKQMIQKLVLIGMCTGIALGMTAVLTLPTFFALQNAYSPDSPFPAFGLHTSFVDVLGNFIAFTPPTAINGLPNLYSGMISIMLLPVFLMAKKISLRKKVAYTLALVFIVLSVNVNVLDYMWSGFRTTNMIPFRFSFLASFLLVFMAYKAYLSMEEVTVKNIAAMALSAALFLFMAVFGPQETVHIVPAAVLSVVYIVLFVLKRIKWQKFTRQIFVGIPLILFAVIIAELGVTAHNGVQAVRTTDRTGYPAQYEQVQQLLAHRQPSEPDFFRTEFARWWTINDPSLYGFNGISFFSSLVNVNATNFMLDIGLRGHDRSNVFYYAETSPLTNAFLNIRYLIDRNGRPEDGGILWTPVASYGDVHLLRNNHYLPFGFMVDGEIINYVGDRDNPFHSQNSLFRTATGLQSNLFTLLDKADHSHNGTVRFYYQMPADGLLYAYTRISGANHARVTMDGNVLHDFNTFRPYIFFAGSFREGEIVGIEADTTIAGAMATVHVGFFNQDIFDQGMGLLAAETLTLTRFTDTRIEGHVTVSERRLLYTSLPHAGNWRVFVNGTRYEIITIGGAMAAVWLDPGYNTVEFRYHNTSLIVGAIISLLSLLVLVALAWLRRKGRDAFEYIFARIFATRQQEERICYLFFGGITTLVNWTVYSVAVQAFSVSVSNVMAWVLAVTFAFVANKTWVFKNSNWKPRVLLKQGFTFVTARLATGLVELVGVPLLFFAGLARPLFGIEGFAAKMVVSIVVVILNYILSKTFVFK